MKIKSKHSSNSLKREKKTPRIIGLGLIKLDFYINLTDQLIKTHNIDLSKINSSKDLRFISEDQNLLDLVQISTTDTLANILLYINKANIQKSFIELITLNPLRFKPEEEFIRKIFSHVTEHNYLFTNEMSVATTPNKISFALKSGKKLLKYFDIVSDYDPFAEEIKKEENLVVNKSIHEADEIKEVEEKNEVEQPNNPVSTNNNNYNNFYNVNDNSNSYNEDQELNDNIVDKMGESAKADDNNEEVENEAANMGEQDTENRFAVEKNEEIENLEKSKINEVENKENESNEINEMKEKSNLEFKVEDIQQNEHDKENTDNFGIQNKDQNISILEKKLSENYINIQINKNNSKNQVITGKNSIGNTNKNPKENQDQQATGAKIDNSYHLDISRTNQSMYKLFNIPAACEIEEYDFIFIDLDEFLNFHGMGLHLIELADFLKKISLANKNPRIVVNFPNILLNLNIVNLELIDIILSIMSYTDIFLFDKRECLAFFNMLSQMNNERELNEKNLFEHFQKEIPHIKSGVSKIGLFMEDLQKFNIIEQRGEKIINKNEHYLNLHPKINHTNQKVIDDYRKIMLLNNNYFKSIFFGGFFAKFIFLEDNYPAFISGLESTKRILELFKNKIDFPSDPDFYMIKLQKAKINRDLAIENLRKKEEQFVLDCINRKTSSIKYYNPLFDDHLNAFFAGGVIRKQLKEKGFINTNGFVLYDPSYKNINPPKIVKKRVDTSEKEKHLLYAIKNNKDIFSTDLDTYSKSIKDSSPTSRRLPIPVIKESSNIYISNKLFNIKKSQKKQLKPLYLSVSRKEKEKEKEENQQESVANSKKNKASSTSKSKSKNNNIFPTQNYNNINKSHLNMALNESNLKDDKNDQSKFINNSIGEVSMLNKQSVDENKKSQMDNNDIINNSVIEQNMEESNEIIQMEVQEEKVENKVEEAMEVEEQNNQIVEEKGDDNQEMEEENQEINMEINVDDNMGEN